MGQQGRSFFICITSRSLSALPDVTVRQLDEAVSPIDQPRIVALGPPPLLRQNLPSVFASRGLWGST